MTLRETRQRYASGTLTKSAYIDAMHEQHLQLFEYADYIRDTEIASIEICDEGVIATYRGSGVRLLCDPDDKRITPIETLNFGSYEQAEARLFFNLVGEGKTFVDIGANVGWYSLTAARHFPHITVHAFEPMPKTFGYLTRNVALNNAVNVKAYNFGFSERNETATFYYYPEGSGNASARNLSGTTSVTEIPAQVKRLDDVATLQGLTIDTLKCDVEGAELSVFRGGIETLREQRPAIFTEMLRKWSAAFGYHPNEIISLLHGLGYRCYTVRNSGLAELTAMDDSTAETNFFFLHPAAHGRHIERLCIGEG
jgi:FkbM family methyltransferase